MGSQTMKSSGKELSDIVAFIGFVVELAQDRGRPMEGLIVVKKGAVKDNLEQGGVDGEGMDKACRTIPWDAEQNLADIVVDQ